MNIDKEALTQAVIKLQNGDGQAFNDVYNLTNQAAFFTAKSITKNEDDAYDVLQESYVKALDKINTVDKPESFMSWFNMIVANKAREMMRKKKPLFFDDYVSEDEDGNLSVQNIIPDEEDDVIIPGADVEREEVRKEVMNLINGLSDEKRTAVILHYYNDMPVAEIADSLGVSENTIKSRLFQARKDLKAGIEALEKKNKSILGIAPMSLVRWALNTDSMGADSKLPDPAELYSRIQAANVPDFSAFGRLTDRISDVFLKISEKFHTLFSNGVDPKPVAAIVVTAGIVGGAIAGTNAVKSHKQEPETTARQSIVSEQEPAEKDVIDNRKYKVGDEDDRNYVLIDKEDKKVDTVVGSEDMEYGNRGIIENHEIKDGDKKILEDNVALMDRSDYSAEYMDLLPAARKNMKAYSAQIAGARDDVNSFRDGLKPLKNNQKLAEQANVRAEEIAHSGLNFSTRPDGTEYTTIFSENGFDSGTMLECRAYGYTDENTAMKKIKRDFANQLKNSDVTDIGVGVALEPQSETYVYVIHLYSKSGNETNSNLSAAEKFRYNLSKQLYEAEGKGVDLEDKNEEIDNAVSDIPVIGELSKFDIPVDGALKFFSDSREKAEKDIVRFFDRIQLGD